MKKTIKKILLFIISLMLPGCLGVPKGLSPVSNFDLHRYLGTWYEIVRLDHSFEKGLNNVSAQYSLREDGGIRVINKGYDPKTEKWKQAEGKAYFVDAKDIGRLKVSFFGPFYGAYNIIDLDHENYSYAMVCGADRSYFWILSRQPDMPESLKLELIKKAENFGFKSSAFIHVKHDKTTDNTDG